MQHPQSASDRAVRQLPGYAVSSYASAFNPKISVSLIDLLIIRDVKVLCDVRKNAFSQKYGFSKSQLEKACEGVKIKYVHVPQLGIDSDKRQELNCQADYDKLFKLYESTTLIQNKEYLLMVRDLIDKYQRVALTCFEKNPLQCHRSYVAKELMKLENVNYKLTNIQ